jgi:hypothetical protein
VTWDEALGDEFVNALAVSVAWHLDEDDARRARALCLTSFCDAVTGTVEQQITEMDIYPMPKRAWKAGRPSGCPRSSPALGRR